MVIHDDVQGLVYTSAFAGSPQWSFFNGGLTAGQKGIVDFFFQTPSGACYCGHTGNGTTAHDAFVARAPALGGTWVILYDVNNLQLSGGARWGIHGAGHNPLLSETVGLVLYKSDDGAPYFYIGADTSFVQGALVSATGYNFQFSVTYGLGKWMVCSYGNQSNGRIKVLNSNGLSVSSTPACDGALNPAHFRAGTTGTTFHQRSGEGMFIGTNNYATENVNTDTDIRIFSTGGQFQNCSSVADPTGQYIMGYYGAGHKGLSSDGGYSWGLLPNLPFTNLYYFENLGNSQKWVAAGGSVIYETPDQGASWANRVGNLQSLIPFPNIDLVRAVR